MRHRKRKYRIGTNAAHRRAIIRGLMAQVLCYGKVKTTLAKSRAVQPPLEKLITLAKKDTVANRRLAAKKLGQKQAVRDLFDLASQCQQRPGGHTRIMRLSDRRVGDHAPMAYLALVETQPQLAP